MKTIVHIGMAKSGSSALQSALTNSRSYLRTKGVLYPKNPPDCPFTNNQRLLALSILSYRNLPRHIKVHKSVYTKENLGQRYAEFLAHLDAQIRDVKPDCMVLSTETLFRPLPDRKQNQKKLLNLYRRFGDTHFVAYVRKPSEHFLSICQQKLKASSQIKQPNSPRYRAVLSSYLDTFGKNSLTARSFHRSLLVDNDVVSDFCGNFLEEYDIDPKALSRGRSNETMSAESMSLVASYRAFFHPDRDDVPDRGTFKFVRVLNDLGLNHGAGRPKLQPGIADLVDYSTTDPLWVRDHFGVEFVGYDYARLELNGAEPLPDRYFRLEDLVVIDPEMRRQLLEDLLHTKWADQDADRKKWISSELRSSVGFSAAS